MQYLAVRLHLAKVSQYVLDSVKSARFIIIAQRIVESLMLVIVQRPFTIGDRVTIDGSRTMYVHTMGITSTTLRQINNKLIVVPNDVLATYAFARGVLTRVAILTLVIGHALKIFVAALQQSWSAICLSIIGRHQGN